MPRTSLRNSAPSPKFTADDLVADMQRVMAEWRPSTDNDLGLSTHEWAERRHVSYSVAARDLSRLWRQGLLEEGRAVRVKRGGGYQRVPVYRLKATKVH